MTSTEYLILEYKLEALDAKLDRILLMLKAGEKTC